MSIKFEHLQEDEILLIRTSGTFDLGFQVDFLKNLKAKAVTKVQEAINIIKKQHPKVIIVDIFLPELDGFDLAEEIYSYAKDAKIILMSGIYDFKEEHLKQLGFEDFLRKPIDLGSLDGLLKKYLSLEQ